jgi:ATP-binding cassette subfamily B protein
MPGRRGGATRAERSDLLAMRNGGAGGRRTSLAALVQTLRLAWAASPADFVLVTALTTVGALAAPAAVALSRRLVDLVARAHLQAIPARMIMPAAVGLGLLGAAQRVLQGLQQSRQAVFASRVGWHAETLFLRKTAQSDLVRFDDPGWHDHVSRISQGLNYRPHSMTQNTIGLASAALTAAGMLGVLVSLDRWLLLFAFLSVLIPLPFQRRINRRMYKFHYEDTRKGRERWYYRVLLSDTRFAKDLRAFVLEDTFLARHRQGMQEYDREFRQLHRQSNLIGALTGLASGAALALAYLVVARRGAAGGLSPGDVTALVAAIASVTAQVNAISGSLIAIDEHAPFMAEFFEFIALPVSLVVSPRPVRLPARLDGISLENVTFTFADRSEPALRDLTLRVAAGEMLALVGDNGAGKTTLVKMLLRFYDPQRGSVRLGGVDLRDADPVEVRDRIGVLFQDYTSFSFSPRLNVGLGRSTRPAADGPVWEALRAARAEEIVRKMPDGLDAMLGRMFQGGQDLSGGEWQRLALARLIFRDADVWILDEPTSSLDPEAEAAVFKELKTQLRGRIGIVISHRFSTVRIADRIAVLDQGRLRELGTHDELMARGGRYAELFELQAAAYR